jgi:transcriptional regulator with XRE-family HTH domain
MHLLRKRRGLSLPALAAIVGVSHQALSGYEAGKHEPTSGTLAKIAMALGTSTDYLVGLRHSPTPGKRSGQRRHLAKIAGQGRDSFKPRQTVLMH